MTVGTSAAPSDKPGDIPDHPSGNYQEYHSYANPLNQAIVIHNINGRDVDFYYNIVSRRSALRQISVERCFERLS